MTSAEAFQFLDGSGPLDQPPSWSAQGGMLLLLAAVRKWAPVAYKTAGRAGRCSAVLSSCLSLLPVVPGDMELSLLVTLLGLGALLPPTPSAASAAARTAQYAVDCPESCEDEECTSTARCKRTVLDDCGCCRVCAAALGETCYRTVSGMDGVKCGPGLRCHFYTEEDDFGDEFGVCRECPYGTFGMECRKTCSCQSGICDRVTGRCLTFPFFQLGSPKSTNKQTPSSHAEHGLSSGDGNDVKADLSKARTIRTTGIKWLNPR